MNAERIEYDVAILGGGFAGVYCAKAIQRNLGKRPGIRIALISEQNYMVFQPMLAEVAGGSLSPRHVVNPLRQLCRGIDVIQAEVQQIDLVARQLEIQPASYSRQMAVKFDHLVLGLGGGNRSEPCSRNARTRIADAERRGRHATARDRDPTVRGSKPRNAPSRQTTLVDLCDRRRRLLGGRNRGTDIGPAARPSPPGTTISTRPITAWFWCTAANTFCPP